MAEESSLGCERTMFNYPVTFIDPQQLRCMQMCLHTCTFKCMHVCEGKYTVPCLGKITQRSAKNVIAWLIRFNYSGVLTNYSPLSHHNSIKNL